MKERRAKIIVKGFVQGVGYRYFTERTAKEYGLTGYVKNLTNGNVEVVVEGDEGLILSFIERLRIGPRLAKVTDIQVEWSEPTYEFDDFKIKFEWD